jgi:glucose-6-phosphate 1-dehydrogenase
MSAVTTAEFCDYGDSTPAPPCVFVVFGGSGDLTRRKLLPSLYNLARQGFLSEHVAILGLGSKPLTDDAFRDRLTEAVREFSSGTVDAPVLDRLRQATYYRRGPFNEGHELETLRAPLEEIAARHGTQGNMLFYLATPPQAFSPIVLGLGQAGLLKQAEGGPWRRVIIEKPFGRDLESARELDRDLHSVLDESQIFRIDHYLGKETVQNLLLLRFTNGLFEPIWNRRYVDHVQILVAEELGVEGRGAYYDTSGAVRDMVQNHMLQLLCLIAMEPPISFSAEEVRGEKVRVLHAIKPMTHDEVHTHAVRGRYTAGVINGKRVPGYLEEPDVDPHSKTETYAAMRLEVENWRWAGVPFYLRTGKHLPMRDTEITIEFRRAPLLLLPAAQQQPPNRLVVHVQPDERIALHIHAKCPGPQIRLAPVEMNFAYSDLQSEGRKSTGYETLLYDCMLGDATSFHRADMIDAAWRIVMPVLETWAADPPDDFPEYPAGTWGPKEANELIQRDGRAWVQPTRP